MIMFSIARALMALCIGVGFLGLITAGVSLAVIAASMSEDERKPWTTVLKVSSACFLISIMIIGGFTYSQS